MDGGVWKSKCWRLDNGTEEGENTSSHGLNCGDALRQVCTLVEGTFRVISSHCNDGLRIGVSVIPGFFSVYVINVLTKWFSGFQTLNYGH